MLFQIERIIVWPLDSHQERNEVTFEMNAVNVITGASRTGKSAICGLIDYCMGSRECSIPVGVVRDNASWYGIVAHTSEGRILFARRNPRGKEKTSVECRIIPIASDSDIPKSIQEDPNRENTDDVVEKLSRLAGITDIGRDDGNPRSNDDGHLSFRDIAHMLFQVQDIMTSRYMLFYKLHVSFSRDKLRDWFNFIIGAETLLEVLKRKEVRALRLKLETLQDNYARAKNAANAFLSSIRDKMVEAVKFGLCPPGGLPEGQDELIALATKIAQDGGDIQTNASAETLKAYRKEIRALRKQNEQLDSEIRRVNKEMSEFESLIENLNLYNSATATKKERLQIAKWMRLNWCDVGECTASGKEGHDRAVAELDRICSIVQRCEDAAAATSAVNPQDISEYQNLKRRSEELIDALRKNEQQIKALQSTQVSVQSVKMNQLIGEIRQVIATAEHIKEHEGIYRQIAEVRAQLDAAAKECDEGAIRARAKDRIEAIQRAALERLGSLDCEDEYRRNPPLFDKNEMNLSVVDSHGTRHNLSEVGSASNWVSMHIAFSCAFQEFFSKMKTPSSCVPNFMVFDQPSQVYFPVTSTPKQGEGYDDVLKQLDDVKLSNDDRESVRKIFLTLARSTTSNDASWQAIVLEHAGDDVYGGIDGIVERANWHRGGALIPKSWYDKSDGEGTAS